MIKELPSLTPLSLSTDTSNEGEYVQLTCIAIKGDLPIIFRWNLNSIPISNSLATTLNVGSQTR